MGPFVLENPPHGSENVPGTGNNRRCGKTVWDGLRSCFSFTDPHVHKNRRLREGGGPSCWKSGANWFCRSSTKRKGRSRRWRQTCRAVFTLEGGDPSLCNTLPISHSTRVLCFQSRFFSPVRDRQLLAELTVEPPEPPVYWRSENGRCDCVMLIQTRRYWRRTLDASISSTRGPGCPGRSFHANAAISQTPSTTTRPERLGGRGLSKPWRLADGLAYVCKHYRRNEPTLQPVDGDDAAVSPTFTSLFSFLHFPKCLSETPTPPPEAAAACFALICALWCVGASSESEDPANVERKSCSPDSAT